ncbi:uncharacterized protein LOC143456921 isoform X1 [Clavelina lepadiformis]|uniref:uncharacterized protein LOC143456921 isoform X1 n=1 Tax=Clavelina lepadiformis TaxID=159417 RepID=UPI00404222C7
MEYLSRFLKAFAFVVALIGSFTKFTSAQFGYSTCPTGFVQRGSACYKLSNQLQVTHQQAIYLCSVIGAKLAEVSEQADYENISNWIKRNGYRNQNYWVSYHRASSERNNGHGKSTQNSDDNCFVILHHPTYQRSNAACSNHNSFVCQHRSVITSDNSARNAGDFSCIGKHGYFPYEGSCSLYILCFNGEKHIYRCAENSVYVKELHRCSADVQCIEENPNNDSETGDSQADSENENEENLDLRCANDFMKHNSKCYKVFHNDVTWDAANESCSQNHARLVTIASHDVMEFLRRLIRGHTCEESACEDEVHDYWIGLNDKAEPDTYVWSDGTTLTSSSYHNWSKRARRRHKFLKECVRLSPLYKFKWLDSICNEEYSYICEKAAVDSLTPKFANCGQVYRDDMPRTEAIVGGIAANQLNHPWLASLRFNGKHKCGASLIDPCWIMTAAHCVSLPTVAPEEMPTEAVLGDYNLLQPEDTEETLSIEHILLHPEWNPFPVPTNDIALLKLRQCSRKHNPVCLPSLTQEDFATGTVCNIAGYGSVNAKRRVYPDRLMEASVPLIDFQTCQSLYMQPIKRRRKTYIMDSMLCAGILAGGVDSCQGDSGGPLTCSRTDDDPQTQWGVVSWGNGCAKRNKPGVYTRVALFVEWIKNVTNIDF